MPTYGIILISIFGVIFIIAVWMLVTIIIFKRKEKSIENSRLDLEEALTAYYDVLTRLCRGGHVFSNKDAAFKELIAWRLQIDEPLSIEAKETYLKKMLQLQSRLVEVFKVNPDLSKKPMMEKLLEDQKKIDMKISSIRRYHNSRVARYNAMINVFPNNIVSRIFARDDYLFFKNVFDNAGALDRIVGFINTTEDPPVERLLIPDMALSAAEYFAVEKNEKVLVLLTDMTLYADALSIVSNRMDQIPSKDSMPGSLYSDLARLYEKAVQLPDGGSITIVAVTTLSGGDITHAIPDNTGYITEGQLFLRKDTDVGKVIIDPFRSLSRLKQLVIGKKTREDHPQVMNAAVRLYADAANAKTKLENGFDLTDYDERTLEFAKAYSEKLLAIDVNIEVDEMLETAYQLFSKYFSPEEVGMRQEYVDKYWKKN